MKSKLSLPVRLCHLCSNYDACVAIAIHTSCHALRVKPDCVELLVVPQDCSSEIALEGVSCNP